MQELRPGLWWWQAPHPDWNERQRWPRDVSSTAIDDGSTLVLIDPNGVPEPLLERAADRDVVVLLTAPWHERDTRSVVDRFGALVHAPPPDSAEDLVRKFKVTPEQAGGGSPDLEWLRSESYSGKAQFYAAGDSLPLGIEAHLGREENDLVLWVPSAGVVVSGDTLVDFGKGFGINESLRGGVAPDEVAARLRPLLELPVELVLSAHGVPVDRAALEVAAA